MMWLNQKLYADKGYINQKLFVMLFNEENRIVTALYSNKKKSFMSFHEMIFLDLRSEINPLKISSKISVRLSILDIDPLIILWILLKFLSYIVFSKKGFNQIWSGKIKPIKYLVIILSPTHTNK